MNSELYSEIVEATEGIRGLCNAADPYLDFERTVALMEREEGLVELPIAFFRATIDTENKTLTGGLWKLEDTDIKPLEGESVRAATYAALLEFAEEIAAILKEHEIGPISDLN